MLQRLALQLPAWARPNHPAIRYVLGAQGRISRRALLVQLFIALIVLAIAFIIGSNIPVELGQSLSERLMNIVFWPLFVIQILISVTAIVYTSGAIGSEKGRQTWDNLRATHSGTGLTLRARWSAAVFYRLTGLISAIYLIRLVLVGTIVVDLTAFRGEYLNHLTGGITPELPVIAGVLLLALFMTASFVLPLTAIGFDAAFGLLVSTFVRGRIWVVMTQIFMAALRAGLAIGMVAFLIWATDPITEASAEVELLSMIGFGAFGDWGLRYLHLAFIGELWATVPYSIFVGAALLVVAFGQALLTDGILAWAIRRAERRE